ncbi:MAG: bile acid:sodium symporter family protein [Novosphingobium sp.]|nr:bile acid:sodium symporter family protein [Novosphingobium sp.]
MESYIAIGVLVAQAVIMLSLGIGLEVQDFKRVASRPYVFAVALLTQLTVLPALAYLTIILFNFKPIFAAGLMLLSFCPGGVTSNIISKLSKADVAFSVSLTAILSIVSFITVPPLIAWSIEHFMGSEALPFSFMQLTLITFLITTTPVLTGVFIRHNYMEFAKNIEVTLEKVAIVLWVVIVTGAVAKTFDILVENFKIIGLGLMFLPFAMMVIGLVISRLFSLSIKESKTLAIEASIQNSPMAITLAATISGGMVINELALPAAVYSMTMYLVALPFIFIYRSWNEESPYKKAASN